MKLKHYALLLLPLLFVGCFDYGYYQTSTYYTYGNSTSDVISIKIGGEGYLRLIATINPGEEATIILTQMMSHAMPFSTPYLCDYVIVSNGKKEFKQYSEHYNKNSLFDINMYENMGGSKRSPFYYKYVFTDNDFKNAEPIN